MTDIVERLRAWADPVEQGYEVPAAGQAMRDGADEIERLRHQCEGLAEAALSNGEDLLRHENEVERLREELDTWQSVFPDIAPEHVQPDRSLLEKEIAGLRAALRSVIEAWDNEYDGEMAVDRAIGEARELLPQTGDEG